MAKEVTDRESAAEKVVAAAEAHAERVSKAFAGDEADGAPEGGSDAKAPRKG